MAKEPLTPIGVDNKMAELYVLSDTDLQLEADAIRTGFQTWVLNHFNLSTSQENYLNGLNSKWIQMASCQLGFAVEHRLPVSLETSAPPTGTSGPSDSRTIMASKLIGSSGGFAVIDNAGELQAEGDLIFSISYE